MIQPGFVIAFERIVQEVEQKYGIGIEIEGIEDKVKSLCERYLKARKSIMKQGNRRP